MTVGHEWGSEPLPTTTDESRPRAPGERSGHAWLSDLFTDKDESFNNAVQSIFSLGDSAFNSPDHHGTPELRAAMVGAGQESPSRRTDRVQTRATRVCACALRMPALPGDVQLKWAQPGTARFA